VAFGHHRIMCINNIHSQVRHHRGMEEKEEEEPPEGILEAPQEEPTTEAGPAKAGPTPAIAGLNTGYSRSARVNSVLAMKPPMLSISLVTKLPLAHGSLYIWVTLPLPRILYLLIRGTVESSTLILMHKQSLAIGLCR
jgi:hypothetical protein